MGAVSVSPSAGQVGDTLTCSYTGFYDADGTDRSDIRRSFRVPVSG